MKHIIVALQFLTRIYLKEQNDLELTDFGKSLIYFPIIGLIIGIITAMPQFLISNFAYVNFSALLAIFIHYLVIGGLHADGFMDSCDGLFSNQPRQRKLEIMKDSAVGANAIIGFIFLVLLKWQALALLPPKIGGITLILIAILSKFGMVKSILKYQYARPKGLGKMFVDNAPKNALGLALLFTLLVITILISSVFLIAKAIFLNFLIFTVLEFILSYILNSILNNYCVKHLGGVTGDTYGFVSECSELLLIIFGAFFWNFIM